jgi:hypothetical protein
MPDRKLGAHGRAGFGDPMADRARRDAERPRRWTS